jgi:stearoyl-CoA desaturase (delta-9 desaturase)
MIQCICFQTTYLNFFMSKQKRGENHVNWLVATVLILLPIFVICGVVIYSLQYGWGWKESILAIVTYYMANISVGIGSHRLWSHGSYKTKPWVELILMIINSGTIQGPILAWASDHKKHHAYADTDKDPHTPLKYKDSKLKGFLWSHIGWMCVGEITAENIDKATMNTLGKNKILQWQLRNYAWFTTFMNIVPTTIFGWLIFSEITIQSTLAGLFFCGFGRALQQQMTFSVNSVYHMLGSRKYASDSSGDIWWLWFLLLGENWHNFHHAFGRDYRNGHKWYHFDIHKWIIALMAKCGLAWDLVITPEERIAAVMSEMKSNVMSDWQEKLEEVEKLACKLRDLANDKVTMIERSASQMADTVAATAKSKLCQIEQSAMNLANNIRSIVAKSEMISAKIVREQLKKLEMLKRAALNAGLKV